MDEIPIFTIVKQGCVPTVVLSKTDIGDSCCFSLASTAPPSKRIPPSDS